MTTLEELFAADPSAQRGEVWSGATSSAWRRTGRWDEILAVPNYNAPAPTVALPSPQPDREFLDQLLGQAGAAGELWDQDHPDDQAERAAVTDALSEEQLRGVAERHGQ